jgi:hypothetical protein
MQKYLTLFGALILLAITSGQANAQAVSINTDGSAADGSALLDVKSTAGTPKGMLVPRMTATDRGNIGSPATGLIVYQTDAPAGFYYNAGTPGSPSWVLLIAGAAGGDLTGTYPNPSIANNAVTSAKIADATIANIDLAANSVTTSKVANGTVTTSKLADDAVTTIKIADGTIVNADVSAAAAIAYSKLSLTNSIQGADVAAGTFTTTNAHHGIGNNDNTARELRMLEPSGSGVNYTALKAQAQAADLTYTLPNTAPTAANQVLQVQAVAGNNATLSWGTIGGGSIIFSRVGVIANAGNTSYNVVSSNDIVAVDMSAGTNFTVNLQPATTAGEILIIKIERYNNALLPILTIQPNGVDKIDGANNLAFGNAGGNRRLYSDGAGNWYSW